jgi:hypothetical protein
MDHCAVVAENGNCDALSVVAHSLFRGKARRRRRVGAVDCAEHRCHGRAVPRRDRAHARSSASQSGCVPFCASQSAIAVLCSRPSSFRRALSK